MNDRLTAEQIFKNVRNKGGLFPMDAECTECGWDGDRDVLEYFRCPSCGSRKLKTEGSRKSKKESLNPPDGAMKGSMGV